MVAIPEGIPVRVNPPSLRHAGVRNDWPMMGIMPPAWKLYIVWPDGSETTEATADRRAAENRARYLSKAVDPWMQAFCGGRHDLFQAPCGTWHRAQSVFVEGNHEPTARDAGATPVLIEGMDADWIINKWWGLP